MFFCLFFPFVESALSTGSEVFSSRVQPDATGPYSLFPAVLAGILGVGALETAYADANEVCRIFSICSGLL